MYRRWQRWADFGLLISLGLILALPWGRWYSTKINLAEAQLEPSWQHPLGTDALGRDNWLRAMEALTGTVPYLWLAVLGGAVLGLVVATRRLDWLRAGQVWRHRLLRAGEQLILLVPSVPLPVFAFAAMVLLRGQGLLTLCLCLGSIVALRFYAQILTNYDRSGRLGHWQAHEAIGGSRQQRVIRYGLQREWAAELLHSLAFYLKASIMTEISLSYLGFGVQEPQASFGNLLGSELRTFLNGHWLLLIVSLIVITLTCEAPFAGWRLVRNRFAAGWRLADQHLAR